MDEKTVLTITVTDQETTLEGEFNELDLLAAMDILVCKICDQQGCSKFDVLKALHAVFKMQEEEDGNL